MNTKITKLLGIKYPIFQGGMAWVAEHQLAAAVSSAGGLGIIAAANAPTEVVREEIHKLRKQTNKPFGVNIMLISPHVEDIINLVCEEKVPIVTTGAGNPEKYIPRLKENGIKVIPVVPSIALAKRAARYGADAVIVEGTEAGGHIGELTTMVLVPQIVDAVDVPVIAAGGIGDGRGMAAALMLGAEGIQMGTRFLSAYECIAHAAYKQKIIAAKDIDTEVTGRTYGYPVRALKNKMTKRYTTLEKQGVPFEEVETMTVGGLRKAVVEGDIEYGSLMAGQIAGLINREQSCQEILEEITKEAQEIITAQYTRCIQVEGRV